MKRFIVQSEILPEDMDPVACSMGIPIMLKNAGVEDVEVIRCYCCGEERKVLVEFEAPSRKDLSAALQKIDFPVWSTMETHKVISAEKRARPMPKFEIYRDTAGRFRFRLRAANNQIIAASEAYETKAGCNNGIQSVMQNAPEATVKDLTSWRNRDITQNLAT
jgi:uncharacterized protein YegP (UPF0339 family)